MSRICAVVALVGLVALGVPVGASGAVGSAHSKRAASTKEPTIRLRQIGISSTLVYTDGVRWAVYEPTAGVTRIMDTVKGTSVSRPDPEGCAGGLLAVGGGEILYACMDPECPEGQDMCGVEPKGSYHEIAHLVVEDIVTGAQHPVAGEDDIPADNPEVSSLSNFNALGSQWLVGALDMYHGGEVFFLNWHSGRILAEESEPKSAAVDFENLNREGLLQPMCSPLARGFAPLVELSFNTEFFVPSEYAPPFLLQERFKAGPRDYHLYLSRCGSTRQEQIPEFAEPHKPRYYVLAGEYSKGVQLGGGVLSYGLGHLWRLDAYGRPWHGRSYRLVGPPKAPLDEEPGILEQHTSTMVFETIERKGAPEVVYRAGVPGNRGPERYGVWVGRLPWTQRHG